MHIVSSSCRYCRLSVQVDHDLKRKPNLLVDHMSCNMTENSTFSRRFPNDEIELYNNIFFYDFLPLFLGYTTIFVPISCRCYRVIWQYLFRFPAIVIVLYGNICSDFLPLLTGYTAIFVTIPCCCYRVIWQYLLRFPTVVIELYNNICYDVLPL